MYCRVRERPFNAERRCGLVGTWHSCLRLAGAPRGGKDREERQILREGGRKGEGEQGEGEGE